MVKPNAAQSSHQKHRRPVRRHRWQSPGSSLGENSGQPARAKSRWCRLRSRQPGLVRHGSNAFHSSKRRRWVRIRKSRHQTQPWKKMCVDAPRPIHHLFRTLRQKNAPGVPQLPAFPRHPKKPLIFLLASEVLAIRSQSIEGLGLLALIISTTSPFLSL